MQTNLDCKIQSKAHRDYQFALNSEFTVNRMLHACLHSVTQLNVSKYCTGSDFKRVAIVAQVVLLKVLGYRVVLTAIAHGCCGPCLLVGPNVISFHWAQNSLRHPCAGHSPLCHPVWECVCYPPLTCPGCPCSSKYLQMLERCTRSWYFISLQ